MSSDEVERVAQCLEQMSTTSGPLESDPQAESIAEDAQSHRVDETRNAKGDQQAQSEGGSIHTESEAGNNDTWERLVSDKWNAISKSMRSEEPRGDSLKQELAEIMAKIEEDQANHLTNRLLAKSLLAELDCTLRQLLQDTGDLNYLALHIRCATQALALGPWSDANKLGWLNNLGSLFWTRSRHLGDLSDLDTALDYFTQAKGLLAEDSPLLPDILQNIGNCYLQKFQYHSHATADFDFAFEHHQQAMLLTPDEAPEMAHRFNSLSLVLQQRYGILGNGKDLDDAIGYQKKSVTITTPEDPEMPGRLGNLGALYQTRFERLSETNDVNDSIDTLSKALILVPSSHPTAVSLLKNLGVSHHLRYLHLMDVNDIHRAVEAHKKVVALTPANHPYLPSRLLSLGASHGARHERLGDDEDLNAAIEARHRALLLIPVNDPQRPHYLLLNAVSYQVRFDYHGNALDIDSSIDLLHQAFSLAPEGHVLIPKLSNVLGGAYSRRFERFQKPEDLDASIKLNEQAVSASTNSADLPIFLANLGHSHTSRFDNYGDTNDIDKGINYQLQALGLLSKNHPSRSSLLGSIGYAYGVRFHGSQQQADIDSAIDYLSKALASVPEIGANKPGILSGLAFSYFQRYRHQDHIDDLDSAIKLQQFSMSLTPKDHPTVPNQLHTLGRMYLDYHERQKDSASLEQSFECFRDSARHLTGDPYHKFRSAFFWARLASSKYRLADEEMDAYTVAMSLVPQMLTLTTTIDEQFSELRKVGDLATAAAAVAIAAEEYDKALEWLEEGRSMVWNHILQLQTPLDQLFSVSPSLASRLQVLSAELHQAALRKFPALGGSTSLQTSDLEKASQRHRRISDEYNRLVGEARQIPGFERFLQLPNSSQLVHAAHSGPLVIVNVDQLGCDALVIKPDHKTKLHIPLINLTYTKVKDLSEKMRMSLRQRGIRSRHILVEKEPEHTQETEFAYVLTTLWRDLVKPILDALELSPRPGANDLPHITWCATGALSFMPIHAAGDYEQPDAKLFNYAITSYTLTLSSLLLASYGPNEIPLKTGILAVGQENTPGHAPLPGTRQELEAIKNHIRFPAKMERLEDHEATLEAVLNKMEEFDWVHLACHAHQDARDPTSSGFFLHNGTLSLVDIAQRRLRNKGLAFLSACQTATGDEKLPNEMAHLAGGMLTGGYRSIIATMWAIMDSDAPMITDKVYGHLLEGESPGLGRSKAARALHFAVQQLREEVGEQEFSRWVPFIHFGA